MHNLELAFHQAGHVVMAMLWGVWRVDKVSLAGTGGQDEINRYFHLTEIQGQEQLQEPGTTLFNATLEHMLGGPVARSLLLGWDVRSRRNLEDPEFDRILHIVQEQLPGNNAAEARAVIREHEPIVREHLKRMWPIVEALAVELVCQQELAEYQIRSIIRNAVSKLPESERSWAISRLRNPASRQQALSSS